MGRVLMSERELRRPEVFPLVVDRSTTAATTSSFMEVSIRHVRH